MKSWFGAHPLRTGALFSLALVVIIAAALWWQLSTFANRHEHVSGPLSGTSTIAVTSPLGTPTGTAASTSTPDPAHATIFIQSKLIWFETNIKASPNDVLIDPNSAVRVTVDGSGQVAAFFKSFTYTPVFNNKPYTFTGSDLYEQAQQVGNSYTVPQNCMQLVYYTAARETQPTPCGMHQQL